MIEILKSSLNPVETNLQENKPRSTSLVSRDRLCRRLAKGPEARAQFVESHINKGLAYQLRAMREAREWSQEELSARVGMPQTAISRLESTTYGKPTITTLKRMAHVFDVALEVRFVPFSKLLNRISGTPYVEQGLSSEAIDVPSFSEEEEQQQNNPQVQSWPAVNARYLFFGTSHQLVLSSVPALELTNVEVTFGQGAHTPYTVSVEEKKPPVSEQVQDFDFLNDRWAGVTQYI